MFKLLSLAAAIAVSLLTPLAAAAETVAFQSRQNGQYVAFDASGVLAARAAGPQAHVFEMIRLEGDRVAFRDPASGRFLRAGVTASTFLALGERHIRGWETFQMRQDGPDVTLRSVQNGKFVRAGVGAETRLAAVSDHARGWETFRLVPVTMQRGPASTGPAPAPDTLVSEPARPMPPTSTVMPNNLPFAGTWHVRDLFDVNGARERINDRMGRMARIVISRSGAVEATVGCNAFSGQIVAVVQNVGSGQPRPSGGVRYRMERPVQTKRGCPDEIGSFEDMLFNSLGDLHTVENNRTTIRIDNDRARRRVQLVRN